MLTFMNDSIKINLIEVDLSINKLVNIKVKVPHS